jgi:hypothetical protein
MQISRKLLAFALIFAVVLAALPSLTVAAQDASDVSSGDAASQSSTASTPVELETAEDEYEEEIVEEVIETPQQFLEPAPDVTTTVKFLGITDNKFTAGKEVTALIGLTNTGDKQYNVSYVGAHLHSPYDVNYYVQNLTARTTSGLLPAKSELTVEYKFTPDAKLETLDFHFSGWVIYNDTAATVLYRSLYANHTVSMIEKRGEWSLQSVLTYLVTIGALAAAAYFGMQTTATGQKVKKAATAATTVTADVQTPWAATAYRPANVQKAAGAKKHAKK